MSATMDRTSRFCHLCGQRLRERYYRFDSSLVVCASCFASRPRCARCGVPVADAPVAAASNGKMTLLCASCLRAAPRCAACQQPIVGVWYTFEELLPTLAQRRFCSTCVQHRPRCDLCRAPVAANAAPLADGQYRCALCSSDMILGDAAAQSIYAEAVNGLHAAAGCTLKLTPHLQIVGRRRMGDVRRRFAHDISDVGAEEAGNHHVLGFFVRAHGTSTIYVELGLPRALLLGTLAHELGHAWQAEQAPHVKDPMLREGFAEWVAHRVLVARGLQAVAARATRRDDLYGRSLRHFLAVERSAGLSGVLALARGLPVQVEGRVTRK
jgi:hypothetical protein